MRVATFNLHAGIDGWGRPTYALDHACSLGADILICPETWRGDEGPDFYEQLAARLSMHGTFVALASGERMLTDEGGATWQPLHAHFTGEHGLYFNEHRELSRVQKARRTRRGRLEHGDWGLTFLTRFQVEDIRVESLGRLPREKVNRSLIIARLYDGDHAFFVLALHGAHLSHGSFLQYRRVNELASRLDPDLPIILAGDFNCWRPLLRVLLPGWTTLVRARTWPARFPHSQIDHVLGRGPWRSRGGGASQGGSDHRALYCDVEL